MDGFGGVDQAGIGQNTKTDHGHTNGHAPLPHTRPVTHVDNVADGAHGAKMGPLHDGTEHQSQAKRHP